MKTLGIRALFIIVVIIAVFAYQFLTARETTFETQGSGSAVVATSLTQGVHTCYIEPDQDISYLRIGTENEDTNARTNSWVLSRVSKKTKMHFPVTSKSAEDSPTL